MGIDILFKIAGVGLITAIINQILSTTGKGELTTFTTLAGLVIVLVMVVNMLGELFDSVKSVLNLFSVYIFRWINCLLK